MAKFDYKNLKYFKAWDMSDPDFVQRLVDTKGLIQVNYGWWRTQFSISPDVVKTQPNGLATFAVSSRIEKAAPLMDFRAPLADSIPEDKEGLESFIGSIPSLITPGFVETAAEREDKLQRLAALGNDDEVMNAWLDTVQKKIDSVNATLSYMGAMLESNGYVVGNFGRGFKMPLQKYPIPADNFKHALDYVWSDTTNCKILSEMARIEEEWRSATGFEGAMVWKIPYTMFRNYFMPNAQIAAWVSSVRTAKKEGVVENMAYPEQMLLEYISMFPGISPIEIVKEKARNRTNTQDVMVNGWNQNNAVLCPAGFVGEIMHSEDIDRNLFEKYGNKEISKVFASVNFGLATLVNSVCPNASLQEYHTDVIMSAIPALTEFTYHVIVDTTKTE